MPRLSPARPSKLTAEELRLQKEADALHRKELELQQQLKRLPAQIEAKRSREREILKQRAITSSPAISLNGLRGTRGAKPGGKRRPLPAREYHNARIKFIVLCLILATIGLLLWRALP